MKKSDTSPHDYQVAAAERAFKQAVRHSMEGPLLDGCLQLWRDFAAQTDLSRTRKPETWAAALLYTFDRLQFGAMSQEETASLFGVSAITVSQKFRQIAEALDLELLDARYLSEARRAAIRRDIGSFPEHLPLLDAPMGFWHLPFDLRIEDPLHAAQDTVYDGWEHLGAGRLRQAERAFRASLDTDPMLADAYNGLAHVAEAKDDSDAAEAHYQRAYELARDALGSESPRAYMWWGELETRPYMRAREGLAWVHSHTGRYREAVAEYEALLRLNPNDNQGVRYLIGPLLQLADDDAAALDAYERYAKAYPDDSGDPHHTFSWGLCLWTTGRREEALQRWTAGLFQNPYLAPLLLGIPQPPTDLWLGTNLAWREYAESYLERFGSLWERHPDAREALGHLWRDPAVEAARVRWVEIGRELHRLSQARRRGEDVQPEWVPLIHEQWAIEREPLGVPTVQRVLADA
jgi:tetratricopeptide (TPR) repeat protein